LDRVEIEPVAKELPPPMFILPPVMSPPPMVIPVYEEPLYFVASPPPPMPPPPMMSSPPMMQPPPVVFQPPVVPPLVFGPPPAGPVPFPRPAGHIAGPLMHPHALAEVLVSVSRSPSPVPARQPPSPVPVPPEPVNPTDEVILEAEATIKDCDALFQRFNAVSALPQMPQLHVNAFNNQHQHDFMRISHSAHETYTSRHPGHRVGVSCVDGYHKHPDTVVHQRLSGLMRNFRADDPFGVSPAVSARPSQSSGSSALKSSAYLRAQAALQLLK